MMDNASVHVSDKMDKFIKSTDFHAIVISPYTPQQNPCEKLIGVIKMYIKESHAQGR